MWPTLYQENVESINTQSCPTLQFLLVHLEHVILMMMVMSSCLPPHQLLVECLHCRPQHGGHDVLVGEEEREHDVVHLAVVWTAQSLVDEAKSLALFLFSGVIEDESSPEESYQPERSEGSVSWEENSAWPARSSAGVSVGLDPSSVLLDGGELGVQPPHELVQGLSDGVSGLLQGPER